MKYQNQPLLVRIPMVKSNFRDYTSFLFALLLTFFGVGIAQAQNQYTPESGSAAYIAEITEMNPELTKGDVSGQAIFIVKNNELSITLAVKGLAPEIMHLQHIHGFISGGEGTCPPPDADTNGDGIVDLMETHDYTGVTLVPFNATPIELKIKSASYPVANKDGLLTYEMSISLDDLKAAIKKKNGIDELSLEDRVIFIHGVPEDMQLPSTVQSLPGVPSHITVPIACGAIKAL